MFSFNGISDIDMGVQVYGLNRQIRAAKHVVQTRIPGRSGTHDATDNSYDNITITMDCVYLGDAAPTFARQVAAWLSGSGALILDDEPDKTYQATVWSEISSDQLITIREFSLEFTCYPFAASASTQVQKTIQSSSDTVQIQAQGTAATPCRIVINNIGDTTIHNLRITHSIDTD